jgi:hypothetical protein
MKEIFSTIIKILLTPILIIIAFLILIFYSILGMIIVPIQATRFLTLTVLASLRSAIENKDYTNRFIDSLFDFIKKYLKFYPQIFYVPMAIWIPAQENPSSLKEIIKLEWELISDNWIKTIIIFISMILSLSISTVLIGVKGFDLLNIENKIYNSNKNIFLIENYKNNIKSIKKKNEIEITELKQSQQTKLDSINGSYAKRKKIIILKNTAYTYLLTYKSSVNDSIVEHSLNEIKEIIKWKKSAITNNYFIISKNNAYELSKNFGIESDSITHLITLIPRNNYQGRLSSDEWNFIKIKE